MREIEMDSMQMDAGATSKDTAAGKGEPRKRKKRVSRIGKKAEEPSVRKTVKETRRRAPVYKVTFPVFEHDRYEFNRWWMRVWGDLVGSMEQQSKYTLLNFLLLLTRWTPHGGIGGASKILV